MGAVSALDFNKINLSNNQGQIEEANEETINNYPMRNSMGSNQVIMNMFQKEDPFNPNSQFNPSHQEYYKDAN
jgi:hypothetical protein